MSKNKTDDKDLENKKVNNAEDTSKENTEAKDPIAELEEQVKQEKEKFLRLFAEFENYKKRTAKERLDLFKTANQELMTVLLPILDDFDRGLAEIKKAEDDSLFQGMKLISDKLHNTLTQKGLLAIEVKVGDTFDAEEHEAITQIPAPSEDLKGKIIDVVEQGYKLGDKTIRFPKVVIGH
ncbi:nucleotide exchange factor GrpE [Aureivirga marina]|uniref:nucleotide exchange factor GrpE n=1 Tax=Aureivirga marina TaxID=1182451 RepID=UPI0018CB629A|nr:nucleotide exchange factor GrpE [Aureivirga marina]